MVEGEIPARVVTEFRHVCSKASQKVGDFGWPLTVPTRSIFTGCCALWARGKVQAAAPRRALRYSPLTGRL